MPNILISCHDPGGANLILSIINFLSVNENYNLFLVLLGSAKEKIALEKNNIKYIDLYSEPIDSFPNERIVKELDIFNIFKNNKFDLIITATSWNSNLEKLIIKYSKINNIKCFSLVDFWSSYLERFTYENELFLPDIIFVTDKKMQKEISTFFRDKAKIIVSGNPYLYELSQNINRHDSLKKSKFKVIRFFSENIKHYHPERKINEFYIVDKLLDFFQLIDNEFCLIIRPHPMESIEPWNEYILNKNISNKIKISLEKIPLRDIIKDDFISIGISSMALIETSICNIPTYSYQIDLSEEDYLYIPFEEYGISRIQEKKDLYKIIDMKNNFLELELNSFSPFEIIEQNIKKIITM